jgi:hypothetical protein
VGLGDLPAAILFALLGSPIGKKLSLDLRTMPSRSLVLVRNHDAVFPAGIFAGVQARSIHGVGSQVAELLFPVQRRNLIFLEDFPELVRIALLDLVDPLDQVGFVVW